MQRPHTVSGFRRGKTSELSLQASRRIGIEQVRLAREPPQAATRQRIEPPCQSTVSRSRYRCASLATWSPWPRHFQSVWAHDPAVLNGEKASEKPLEPERLDEVDDDRQRGYTAGGRRLPRSACGRAGLASGTGLVIWLGSHSPLGSCTRSTRRHRSRATFQPESCHQARLSQGFAIR
jgi:hypothetical protein